MFSNIFKRSKKTAEQAEQTTELDQENLSFGEELTSLRTQLDSMGGENQALREQNERLTQELNLVEGRDKENRISLSNELDSLKQRYDQTREELNSLRINQPLENTVMTQTAQQLQDKIRELEEDLEEYQDKMEEYYHKNLVYSLLVSKYKDYIEERETKTIEDLKKAVQPNNTNIQEIVEKIISEFQGYDSSFHAEQACKKAYDYVMYEIESIPALGVQFWMTIKQIFDRGAADYEDKAILLCSMFLALGAESRILIVELTNGSTKPLVLLKCDSKQILCDPNSEYEFNKFIGSKEELIRNYTYQDESVARILYEFNNKEYTQH